MNWYFAFGANMCPDVMERRRIPVISAEPAWVEGYALEFSMAGLPVLEPAFASISADPNGSVHGVLYELSRDALDRLGTYEADGYREIHVSAIGETIGAVEAITYQSHSPTPGLRPSRRYVQVLIAGAVHHGLPDDYIETLRQIESVYIPGVSEVWGMVFAAVDHIHRKLARATPRVSDTVDP